MEGTVNALKCPLTSQAISYGFLEVRFLKIHYQETITLNFQMRGVQ